MWLVAAVYFALRFASDGRLLDAGFLGMALGLAMLTKATACVFAPWPLAVILLAGAQKCKSLSASKLGVALLCALAINTPLYIRNFQLSGSPLGFDSAQGDGVFRWRNETFGWEQTASNVLRNLSEQLGARSESWNRGVYNAVAAIHQRLGIDLNDPATTWHGLVFTQPRNANHEADAPNRWQLLMLMAIGCVLAWRAIWRGERLWAWYAASLACGFLQRSASTLKWQPFMARMFLPLFVLGALLAGRIGDWGRDESRRSHRPPSVCFLLNDCPSSIILKIGFVR